MDHAHNTKIPHGSLAGRVCFPQGSTAWYECVKEAPKRLRHEDPRYSSLPRQRHRTTYHWEVPWRLAALATAVAMPRELPPAATVLAIASSCSIFSSVIDFRGMIFGLHNTSVSGPRSECTRPLEGRISSTGTRAAVFSCKWEACRSCRNISQRQSTNLRAHSMEKLHQVQPVVQL